jgi:SAM-dependent methyltransferase
VASERRLAFGEIAELYDQARPTYPPALIDDVLGFAGAGPGDHAVEVGAGTGKATVLFAERGVRILALEPSAEMAQIARRNAAGFPNVEVREVEFEHCEPEKRVKLVYSAQAWHWIEPGVRLVRAAETLDDGGALAAFWNGVIWENSPLRHDLDAAYERHAPELARRSSSMRPRSEAPRDWLEWEGDLRGADGFMEPERREYEWLQRYSTEEYVALLQTHSDHVVLDPSRRRQLLQAVGRVIDSAGGTLELEYVTRLALARREARKTAPAG